MRLTSDSCVFADDYEDELQMAAATWDDASEVRVAPPAHFVAPHPEAGEESQDQVTFIIILIQYVLRVCCPVVPN